ncbi:DUF2357 domain-containing protein [Trichormus sp. NMC-1]|uniref:DUF2357 domain-containing protein n=1 Tax=Trichormus sp. NMC-1 TaxID=1853259 RepID=UPI0008DC24AD|nr:DUF2357 domain-containing protein [Trichormus sp. NMC-1]
MKIYPSLFAYLNNSPMSSDDDNLLKASQRPVIVLESEEVLSAIPWLIPIDDRVYEVGFPYLQPTDLQHDQPNLVSKLNLDISGQSCTVNISDEVLDVETIKEESEIEAWENKLGKSLVDKTTAELIRLFIGMFTEILTDKKSAKAQILLIDLSEKLAIINLEDANLPIVISLDRKYQLHRKLEAISDRLRHQLRRQAELMPVGRIQEMDSYCLRDYVRRPGLTAVEKAGSKQQLMGIKRYQDFNTPENKFLGQILGLNCFQYKKSGASQFQSEIRKIRLVIDLFKQQPIVKTIQDRSYQFTKPNYVLQQNPIYRSFYQAYLEYLRRKNEKQRVWSFRSVLLADTVYIYLAAALLKFEGIDVDANLAIIGSLIPDKGRYLERGENITVKVFLEKQVYVFSVKKQIDDIKSDLVLDLEIHQLDSMELETKKLVFPIWVFWYRPSDEIIMQMQEYVQDIINTKNVKLGLLFYLQFLPSQVLTKVKIEHFCDRKLWLVPLPNPITLQGFDQIVNFIAKVIQASMELTV